jgi:hypothetical protein
MTDPNEARVVLSQQLKLVEQEKQRQIRRRTAEGWGLGPIRFAAPSGLITIGYIAFHVTCLAVGIVLIIHGGTPKDIGIAVVVGAIFAFGSFMAQWWAVVVQRELSVRDAANQESDAALWHELALQRADISRQLAALEVSQLGQKSSANPPQAGQPLGESSPNAQPSSP